MASTAIRIGPADHGRAMTWQQFQDAEEEPGYLYELVRGVLEVTEVPGDLHAQVVDNLHRALDRYRDRNPTLILRIGHGSDVRFSMPESATDRHPDVAVTFHGAPRDGRGRRQPALVIEVVSPGSQARRRDYEEKREEYLQFGIREYWIVDPESLQVTTLHRREEEVARWEERIFRGEDRIVSDLLPTFELRVDDLWGDLEEDPE